MVEDENADLYKVAMNRIDVLVDEVFERCEEVADENHFERSWVLDRFREKFNATKRKLTK